MPSVVLRSGVPDAHTTTRQRLTSQLDLPRIYRTIDADPTTVGAGLVHIGSDYQVTVLREFLPLCGVKPKRVILREVAGVLMTADDYAQLAASSPRESQLWKEALRQPELVSGNDFSLGRYFAGGRGQHDVCHGKNRHDDQKHHRPQRH